MWHIKDSRSATIVVCPCICIVFGTKKYLSRLIKKALYGIIASYPVLYQRFGRKFTNSALHIPVTNFEVSGTCGHTCMGLARLSIAS